ncbi:MAG: hypothetical protein FJ087_10370 [Deltaproteobacteria bacterium]|nr:hypothetical protein [Deltaproteobacteria bacterium]
MVLARLLAASLVILALACGSSDESGGDATADTGPGDAAGEVTPDLPDAADPGPADSNADPDPAPADAADAAEAEMPSFDVPVETGVNYVVIAEDGLLESAKALAAWREGLGYHPAVFKVSDLVSGGADPLLLVAIVQSALRGAREKLPAGEALFLVLYGDAPGEFDDTSGRIPAIGCENESDSYVGCRTDNTYGDLDGDGVPEAAVGRIPVADAAEGAAFLAKLQAHETAYENGLWNRRVSLYTGQANFSPEIDLLIETAVMEGLKRMSHAFDIVGAYDNPNSPYYYAPFEDKVIDVYNGGSLMTVYIGHGSEESMQGLSTEQIAQIHCAHRLPVALFLACWTGNYAGEDDSISERVIALPDGPIAAFASTDVSHPYPNALLAYEAQRAFLDARPATIGEALRLTKDQVIHNDDEFRMQVDAAAEIQVSKWMQKRLKRQHLDLYNLLGDPATPVKYPGSDVAFDPVTGKTPDGPLHVAGAAPGVESGSALVTLETERDVIRADLEEVDPDDPDPATVQANWAKAIDKVVVGVTVPVANGRFEADLTCPDDLPLGTYWIKVYASTDPAAPAGTAADSFGAIQAP